MDTKLRDLVWHNLVLARAAQTRSGIASWREQGPGNYMGSHAEDEGDSLEKTCVYVLQRHSNGMLVLTDSETSPGSAPQTTTVTSSTHRAELETLLSEVSLQVSERNLRGRAAPRRYEGRQRERLMPLSRRDLGVERDRGSGLFR